MGILEENAGCSTRWTVHNELKSINDHLMDCRAFLIWHVIYFVADHQCNTNLGLFVNSLVNMSVNDSKDVLIFVSLSKLFQSLTVFDRNKFWNCDVVNLGIGVTNFVVQLIVY